MRSATCQVPSAEVPGRRVPSVKCHRLSAINRSHMEEEEALLYTLQRLRGGPLHPGALSNEELVLTGSGFSGGTRLAVRELAALAGLEYSGDLVRGRTTHLVLLRSSQTTPAESAMAMAATPPAGTASVKRECALRWGIPCVRLAWLLDSCETGRALPVHPYLASTNNKQQVAEAANAQKQQAVAPPHSCQQLARRARPSSTASNTPSAAPARNLQLAAGGSGRDSSVQQRQQQPQVEQHPMTSRAVLAPVANMLADELRRMSISPEPPEALAAAAGSCQHHQQQRQQRLPPQSTDNLPLQRSPLPPGSPQHSLSLQGLVEPAGDGSQAGSPGAAAAASSMHASAASTPQHRPSCLLAAGHAACPTADGSMQQPPAQDALSFQFCLGRSRSTQDLPGGSPMAESPAVGTLFPRSSEGSQGTEPSMQQQRSQPAGTPATEGSPQMMGTLPTPACVRQWSDDDSPSASPPPVGACGECSTVQEGMQQAHACANGHTATTRVQAAQRSTTAHTRACLPYHADRRQRPLHCWSDSDAATCAAGTGGSGDAHAGPACVAAAAAGVAAAKAEGAAARADTDCPGSGRADGAGHADCRRAEVGRRRHCGL